MLTPASRAASSRRRPGTHRLPPYAGSPACCGAVLARREARNVRIAHPALVVGDGSGDGTAWLEPVTDEQYANALSESRRPAGRPAPLPRLRARAGGGQARFGRCLACQDFKYVSIPGRCSLRQHS